MPVLVCFAPPEILQAAPELVRLLDAANLLPACGFRFRRKLMHQPPERFLQALRQLLVALPVGRRRLLWPLDSYNRRIGVRDLCLYGHSFLACTDVAATIGRLRSWSCGGCYKSFLTVSSFYRLLDDY